MTSTTKEVYREGFHSLYTLFKNNPLYSDDIAKMCCEYALYDKENHTLLKTTKASIVNWLVENGENIHANEEEALKVAIQRGVKPVVKALLHHGADISINRYAPVEIAIDCGYPDIVELLLNQDR
ncbi:MAG: ankyrin repeat domain-containing protein, partial [bacterium]